MTDKVEGFEDARVLVGDARDTSEERTADLETPAQQTQSSVLACQLTQAPDIQPTLSTSQLRRLLAIGWQPSDRNVPQDLAMLIDEIFARNMATAMQRMPSESQHEQFKLLWKNKTFDEWIHGFLCGELSEKVRSSSNVWTFNFFCGLHLAENQGLNDASGLMRAMALQMTNTLKESEFPVQGVDLIAVEQRLAKQDLDTICRVFRLILRQIPDSMVFIFIDGAYHYGTAALAAEMRVVMRFLNKLVGEMTEERQGLWVRVLVTNPTWQQLHDWGFEAETVELERVLLTGGHRGAWM